jgi:hypothetical protein
MELIAIALSVPSAFVASIVYCMFVTKIVRRLDRVSRAILWLSAAVLGWFAVEVVLLVVIGAVRARTLLGPGFYAAHLAVFFLGTPALANVMLLRPRTAVRWYMVVPLCTAFALVLVLLQYGVSEALYGVDGIGGPFSRQTPMLDVQSYKM